MGSPQGVYDVILDDHLLQPESVDTDIPPAQRSTIRSGVKEFVEDGEQVHEGTTEYEQDKFYLFRIFDEFALLKNNADASIFEDAEPVEFPLIDYLESPGVRAYVVSDKVYELLGYAKHQVIPGSMIFVYDTPYPEEELSK